MRRNVNIAYDLDWVSVLLYLALVFIGWLNIYAAVYSENHANIFDISQRYGKQMLWIFAAILMCFMALFIDVKFYPVFANITYAFSILMLLLVAFFGKEINGARSWFELGPFSLQPTEFAKIGTALAVAKYISSYNVKLNNLKQILIVGAITFFPAIFIALQPDLGSILVFAAFFVAFYREGFPGEYLIFGFLLIFLFIMALVVSKLAILIVITCMALVSMGFFNKRMKDPLLATLFIVTLIALMSFVVSFFHIHIDKLYLYMTAIGGVMIAFAIKAVVERTPNTMKIVLFLVVAVLFTFSVNYGFTKFLAPHQQERVDILLGKKSDLKGAEYNVNQSKIAIGSGGFFGKGFLQGTQTKYNFVPEQSTDFIFCTIGEEWGFFGAFVVLSLFGALILRLLFLAERQKSTFSRVYGYCVAAIFFIHVIINVGMTIGILPVIGIPLPFMSYGGSSLWAFTILLFIFLRLDVSRLELFR